MKIIINQPRASYFVGGAEMISFYHAINFLKLNNDVYFFTLLPESIGLKYSDQFKHFREQYSSKIKIIEISQDIKIKPIYNIQPGEDRCRWNVESIFYNQKLYEYIQRESKKYDVIFSYYNLDSVFICREFIKKNVLYLCGIPREQNDFQGSFLYAYDIVIAISNEVKKAWQKYCDKIHVISTGVDYNRFSLKKYVSLKKKEIIILYVGRLIYRKNVDKVIAAFENLRNKYNLKLFIIGDGPDRERLKALSNNAMFFGIVENTEEFYMRSDIFVSPSEYGEGLQGTILEAMSCGLTVVATNTKVNREILSDGRGFVVDTSFESIVDGITKAITANRPKISQISRKYIIENYDWISKSKKILEVIK